MNLPEHLAIIMDGNGRWAQARNHNRYYGHVRGAQVAKKIIEHCAKINIKNLTLFTFSNENWERPIDEVTFLMKLFVRQIRKELKTLEENNIRVRCIGNLRRLPEDVQELIKNVTKKTSKNTGMNLTFAISYGGRQEIVDAIKDLSILVAKGDLNPDQINENTFRTFLGSSCLPDPDLIVRTSGESRLSNFFLWQAAYSEIFISEKLWPNFSVNDLDKAIEFFSQSERRFGKTSEQVNKRTNSPNMSSDAFLN